MTTALSLLSMTNRVVRFIMALLLMITQQAQAQCLSSSEMLANIVSIQNDSLSSNKEKIEKLHNLQQLFLKCNKTKDSVYARIVHRLGNFYNNDGNFENAIRYTKEAVAINSAAGLGAEKSYLAHSYLNLGNFYYQLYFLDDAQHFFDNCIDVGKNYPEKYYIVLMAFEQKAYASFQTGDYQKSIETADIGILFAQKINDTLSEALLLSQKAQVQAEINDGDAAEKNIKRAVAILANSGNTIGLANAYNIYAGLLEKRNPGSAVQYYYKSFELNKSVENWIQCSRTMTDLGYLYNSTIKDDKKAITCYQQALKMQQRTADMYHLAAIYINMGVVYWGQKNYTKALRFYQKALNTLPINFTDTSIKSNPTENMLRLVANDYFVSTLLSNKAEAFLAQYKQIKKEELLKAALATYQAADKAVDLMRWKQFGEQSKLLWRERTKSMYENAIETCYLLNNTEKAYYFFEKSRAVLLNDKLSELGAKKFLALKDRKMEQQLRIKVASFKQQLPSVPEDAPGYNAIRQQLLSAQEENENFIKSLEAKYPLYYQYKYGNSVYSLTAVKAVLRQNKQSLVEFFTTDSIVYVLFVAASGEKFLKVDFKEYGAVVRELMALCSDLPRLNQNYARYQMLAHQLYDRLFRPLNVPAGRVIISPDDHFIPFEALLSNANVPSSFLLKTYAFSYAYSMELLLKGSPNIAATRNSFLGIAPINYQPYLAMQSLNGADQSLKNIKPYFQNTRFLIEKNATKQQLLHNLAQFKTVQIYSHADADSAGKQPVLYLYDSVLDLSEIQALENMHTDMIVLSACKTGIGKHARGEGVFSLARGFLAVGIPTTITTLWQIESKATYQLTEAFYKYLNQGSPKDEAMQKAKLEFLESGDKIHELPYYWAANIVLGKTTNASVENAGNNYFPGALIATTVLLVIFLLYILIRKLTPRKN